MKVVCIGIPKTNVNISLELGKVYDAFLLDTTYNRSDLSNYWCVRDDLGNIVPIELREVKYSERCFITLSEFREMKLKELGI